MCVGAKTMYIQHRPISEINSNCMFNHICGSNTMEIIHIEKKSYTQIYTNQKSIPN